MTNIRLLSYLEDLTMNISGLDIIYDSTQDAFSHTSLGV